jgi:hypothetical protein
MKRCCWWIHNGDQWVKQSLILDLVLGEGWENISYSYLAVIQVDSALQCVFILSNISRHISHSLVVCSNSWWAGRHAEEFVDTLKSHTDWALVWWCTLWNVSQGIGKYLCFIRSLNPSDTPTYAFRCSQEIESRLQESLLLDSSVPYFPRP